MADTDSEFEQSVLAQTGLTHDDLYNAARYIQSIRTGLPGSVVRTLTESLKIPRFVVSSILKVDESNISRLYQRSRVSEAQSEAVMDTTRLLLKSLRVFGDSDKATAWLQTPLLALDDRSPYSLMDTFEGRKWIDQVLTQIEHGEFM